LWYKVKWTDYLSEYNQWISEQDLDDTSELHETYNVRVKKETKEGQGERSKNVVKMKVKSHYCTHIEQLKPKITFKEWRQTQVKPWVNHKKSTEKTPSNSELIHSLTVLFFFSNTDTVTTSRFRSGSSF
jgi:hypothetical protein